MNASVSLCAGTHALACILVGATLLREREMGRSFFSTLNRHRAVYQSLSSALFCALSIFLPRLKIPQISLGGCFCSSWMQEKCFYPPTISCTMWASPLLLCFYILWWCKVTKIRMETQKNKFACSTDHHITSCYFLVTEIWTSLWL